MKMVKVLCALVLASVLILSVASDNSFADSFTAGNRYEKVMTSSGENIPDIFSLNRSGEQSMGISWQQDELSDELYLEAQRVYYQSNEELRDTIFYGGVESAQDILLQMAEGLSGSNMSEEEKIDLCYEIYIQVWIRSRGGFSPEFMTPAYIRTALCSRFSDYPEEIVLFCTDAALDIIYQKEPELKKNAERTEFILNYIETNATNNKEIEDDYLSDPEYGLTPEKPIFVAGFGNDKEYLNHLYNMQGEKLVYVRQGSIVVKGISGPVDLYNLINPDQSEYTNIYICVYGTRNNEIVPKGIIYK